MGPHTRRLIAATSTIGVLGASALAPVLSTVVDRAVSDQRPAAASEPGAAATDPVEQLRADLQAILDQPGVAAAHASLVVRTADGRDTLFSSEGSDRLLPASNAKLFSSAAALEVLGPDHRFTTSVLATGERRGRVLHGDLYLRGQGDPTMLAEDYDELAEKVAAEGIERVQGRLVADDTWYDDVRLGNNWAWDDEPYYYSAQVSALTVSPNTDYDAGTVIVDVRPGSSAGKPAKVTVIPETDYVKVDNRATTSASGGNTIAVERLHGTNTIRITGTIPMGADVDRSWASVWEPTGYAVDVFRKALARHGVHVARQTEFGATPSNARLLASHESMPLRELLTPFLKLSNNGHAEVLVKEMGRAVSGEGSWSAGLAAQSEALRGLGVDVSSLRFVDGSGLSRQDFVPADQIANLLVAARTRPWFDVWYDALPVAGVSDRFVGGTLRSRMVGTPAAENVHAKTGSLTAVSALSGYVDSADGEPLVFAMVQNNYLGINAKQVEDQVAIRLAEFSRTAQPDQGVARIPSVPKTTYGPDGVECSWVKAC